MTQPVEIVEPPKVDDLNSLRVKLLLEKIERLEAELKANQPTTDEEPD